MGSESVNLIHAKQKNSCVTGYPTDSIFVSDFTRPTIFYSRIDIFFYFFLLLLRNFYGRSVYVFNTDYFLSGDMKRRRDHYVRSKDCYYFDRSIQCFESILYYYQSGGVLIRPPHIPLTLFLAEIAYFDLGKDVITNLEKKEGWGIFFPFFILLFLFTTL